MNPGGAVESAEHVASGFIEALRREPLSLALVLMNLALLVFFWVLLSTVAAQREREVNLLYADHKEVRDLLAKCVVPSKSSLFLPR
jgi:hypothetical protein